MAKRTITQKGIVNPKSNSSVRVVFKYACASAGITAPFLAHADRAIVMLENRTVPLKN